MGPRRESLGNQEGCCDGNDIHRASMGPRRESLGNPTGQVVSSDGTLRFNGAEAGKPRKSKMIPNTICHRDGFNGAEAGKPRKSAR